MALLGEIFVVVEPCRWPALPLDLHLLRQPCCSFAFSQALHLRRVLLALLALFRCLRAKELAFNDGSLFEVHCVVSRLKSSEV